MNLTFQSSTTAYDADHETISLLFSDSVVGRVFPHSDGEDGREVFRGWLWRVEPFNGIPAYSSADHRPFYPTARGAQDAAEAYVRRALSAPRDGLRVLCAWRSPDPLKPCQLDEGHTGDCGAGDERWQGPPIQPPPSPSRADEIVDRKALIRQAEEKLAEAREWAATVPYNDDGAAEAQVSRAEHELTRIKAGEMIPWWSTHVSKSGELNDLVALRVIDARYDGESIYLNLPNRQAIQLTPWGDCCSHCYIQHVSNAFALINAKIVSIEDIESVATQEEIDSADVLDAWGHRITTTRGVCSIEMRLSHNGYYGGALQLRVVSNSEAKVLDDF